MFDKSPHTTSNLTGLNNSFSSNIRGNRRHAREPVSAFAISVTIIYHGKSLLPQKVISGPLSGFRKRWIGRISTMKIYRSKTNDIYLHLVVFQGHLLHVQKTRKAVSPPLQQLQILEPENSKFNVNITVTRTIVWDS